MSRSVAALLVVVIAGTAMAGPVDGPSSFKIQVPASKGSEIGEAEVTKDFRGGERACVLLVGDHRPVVDLELRVYEVRSDSTEQKLVARDGGGKDIIGAVWIPPRTGTYRIVIRNPSAYQKDTNPFDDCYIAIK